jgi:hypothetical protein
MSDAMIDAKRLVSAGVPLSISHTIAAIEAAYRRGWNDREADFMAGVNRTGMAVVTADAIAAARRDGMEQAAGMIDCGCECRGAVLEGLRSTGERHAGRLCKAGYGQDCLALQAAAIRAAAKEDGK